MKNILKILLVLLLVSCESELEITAPSELNTTGFWTSEEGAKAAHSGLYGAFRGSMTNFWLLGEIRSDMWGGQTFESPANLPLIESNITVSTAPFGGWAGFYGKIHHLNDFIANAAGVTFSNESQKQHMLGQAYGLRAFYYYTLLKTWGAVPITTESLRDIDPASLSKPRSSEQEVMDLIKSDLEISLEHFGNDASFWNGKRIYWSKAATLALKGDVYIWSGNLLGGGASDFNTAKNALSQIASMGVSLEPDFANLWSTENETNTEFIFAVDYEQDQATNYYSLFTGRTTEIHPQFDQHANAMNTFITNGANRYGPSEKTLQIIDDSLDTRKDATFIQLYKDDNQGEGYSSYNPEQYFGAILNKFVGSVDGSVRIADNDIPVYRYADVLLLLAEAKNLLNEDPSTEINLIRQRAYGSNYDPSIHGYVNGTKEQNTNAILEERYKEFIAEGKRWWDLRRAGAKYVFANNAYLDQSKQYMLVLPITLDMIGRNPLLEQTPGYPQ